MTPTDDENEIRLMKEREQLQARLYQIDIELQMIAERRSRNNG